MEIVLTRHTSVDVPPVTCYGWSDVNVRDTFEQEAAVTKARLDQYDGFDIVYSSPLTRARKLATYCGFPDHVTDDRLKEMYMGEWELREYDEIDDPNLQRWYEDYLHIAPTGGESFPRFYERVASFFDELRQKPYRRVAIFAHDGVLICAGIYAGLFKPEDCYAHHTGYGETQVIHL